MELTALQQKGLKIAVERYKNHEPWTCISGYAGTGKSTLVKFIISALNLYPEEVCYIAYTGKATMVLKEKGCPNAMTAHKLLYQSYPRKDGTFYHKIKRPLNRNYKLIVVDEVSMLPLDMWEILLSHNIYVLALGDPGQLPPIVQNNRHDILEHPHIFLDEIMRQAQESEIIRLTMDIRDQKPLTRFIGNEVQILNANEYVPAMCDWADKILVGKNSTRIKTNALMRKRLFNAEPNDLPLEGEHIICLRNNWECVSEAGDSLVNGMSGYIHNTALESSIPFITHQIRADFVPDSYTFDDIELSPQDLFFRKITMDYNLFTSGEPTINKANWSKIPQIFKPNEFDYGYCITCHKSQGSEYDKVLVIEEYLKGSADEHSRWLYTAATRAKKKLVIIKR